MTRSAILLAALIAASPAKAACPLGEAPLLQVRIYFGLMEGGKQLSDPVWEDFLAHSVTPRFPAGYTVYDAVGRWRDLQTKIIGREPTKIVEVDAPDTKDVRARVEDIRKDYGTRFHQQAVGIVTLPACGAF